MTMFSDSMMMGIEKAPKVLVSSTSASSLGGTTFAMNKPSGVQVGDTMFALIWGDGLAACSLAGWSLAPGSDLGASTIRVAILTRVVDGTEGSSFSFSATNTAKVGHILAYRGVSGIDIIGAVSRSGSGVVISASSIMATVEGVLIGAFCILPNARTVSTPPAGMSLVTFHNTNMTGYVYDLKPSAPGATGAKGVSYSGTGADKAALLMQIY